MTDYDVVVVGSGFGGSVSGSPFHCRRESICLAAPSAAGYLPWSEQCDMRMLQFAFTRPGGQKETGRQFTASTPLGIAVTQ
jgi:hypothetical protein